MVAMFPVVAAEVIPLRKNIYYLFRHKNKLFSEQSQ